MPRSKPQSPRLDFDLAQIVDIKGQMFELARETQIKIYLTNTLPFVALLVALLAIDTFAAEDESLVSPGRGLTAAVSICIQVRLSPPRRETDSDFWGERCIGGSEPLLVIEDGEEKMCRIRDQDVRVRYLEDHRTLLVSPE